MVRIVHYRSGSNAGQPASIRGRVGLSLFFVFFFLMGSLFTALIGHAFARAMGQRSWKSTPCTIIAGDVQDLGGDSPYAFAVSYRYDYGGKPYSGSTYKRDASSFASYSDARDLVGKYPAGADAICYVNPQNPAEAVLCRDSLFIGVVILLPLIFVAIGAGGVYFVWRKPPAGTQRIAPIARGTRKSGRYAPAALFGVFAIVGGAMLYPLGIKPVTRTLDAERWLATPCKVLRAEVRDHRGDDSTTYSVYVLYEYELDGRTYKSDRFDFIGGSSSGYDGKARVVEQYRTAANPVCYVNPKNPYEAVLERGFHAKLLLALFPLPFLLIGVIGLIFTLRRRKGGASLSHESGLPATSCAPDLQPQPVSGPATLKPKCSARGKFVGALLFASLWNVLIWVFFIKAGGFALFILVPFAAVGVVAIGLVVYQFLALFNPRPTLHVSSRTVPLGGAAELRWGFSGRTGRIRELVVTLRGVERATYRRGTDTCHDESLFYEMELYRTSNAAEIASGQVGFLLPHDTMHSFNAPNNRIIWRLDMRGDIVKWPDVKESFEIEVTPAAGGR